mmetsp:Transcript_96908/g.273920  ORF Transcript_96908/g.273920 Transcript_96908/m.273920 type:complete len:207 (+) Transcript_96908:373-993(+)
MSTTSWDCPIRASQPSTEIVSRLCLSIGLTWQDPMRRCLGSPWFRGEAHSTTALRTGSPLISFGERTCSSCGFSSTRSCPVTRILGFTRQLFGCLLGQRRMGLGELRWCRGSSNAAPSPACRRWLGVAKHLRFGLPMSATSRMSKLACSEATRANTCYVTLGRILALRTSSIHGRKRLSSRLCRAPSTWPSTPMQHLEPWRRGFAH